MNPYVIVVCIHVVVAVLGLGQVTGMLVLASGAEETVSPATWRVLERLVRGISWSLLVMLLTGVLIEYLGGGGFHHTWWFRLSFLLLLALGAISGATRRALRKRGQTPAGETLRRVRRAAWAMCTLIAVVTVLMESKPW